MSCYEMWKVNVSQLGTEWDYNIQFQWGFVGSFLYLIENSDFCTNLDPFPAKNPNLDLKRKFGP